MKHKALSKLRFSKGFTLMEMLVVIAIIAILIAIAIPILSGQKEKTEQAVLKYNTRALYSIVMAYSFNYSKDDWYGDYKDNDFNSLNNCIEKEYETIVDGTYENHINLINPYSKHLSIVDFTDPLSSSYKDPEGYCPAVFLTANPSYSYSSDDGDTSKLIGTIVVFFDFDDNTTDHLEFYYVNQDGSKSDYHLQLS